MMDIEKKDEGLHAADADSWTLPQPIAIYLWSSAFFTFLCAALILFWRAHHWPYPYNTVFMPDALCRDLWCYKPQFLELHTVNFFRPRQEELFPYPPGSVLPFILFQNILPEFHSIPYIGLTLLGVVGLAILLIQEIVRLGVGRQKASALVAVAATLMFPFWFVWSTGNIEIFLFLALSCSIIAFLRGKLLLAAVLIGFCASMKLYPFIFVALFLSIKRYREMAVAAGSFVLFTLMGLWFMTPHLQLSWEGTRAAMKANRSGTMQTFFPIQSSADHALWGFAKTILYVVRGHTHFASRALAVYMACTACLGLVLYFASIRRLPLLNQIFCLYLCMLVLVPESFEYTLIHLAVPWGLLVLYTIQCAKEGRSLKRLTPAFLCLAFVLSAQNELLVYRGYWGQAKCLVLVALLVLSLTSRWEGFENLDWITNSLRRPVQV